MRIMRENQKVMQESECYSDISYKDMIEYFAELCGQESEPFGMLILTKSALPDSLISDISDISDHH